MIDPRSCGGGKVQVRAGDETDAAVDLVKFQKKEFKKFDSDSFPVFADVFYMPSENFDIHLNVIKGQILEDFLKVLKKVEKSWSAMSLQLKPKRLLTTEEAFQKGELKLVAAAPTVGHMLASGGKEVGERDCKLGSKTVVGREVIFFVSPVCTVKDPPSKPGKEKEAKNKEKEKHDSTFFTCLYWAAQHVDDFASSNMEKASEAGKIFPVPVLVNRKDLKAGDEIKVFAPKATKKPLIPGSNEKPAKKSKTGK